MKKKEYYKHNLPHFQQPGQAYFITWSLKDAVPKHVMKRFTQKLKNLKSQIEALSRLHSNRGSESAKPSGELGLADSDPPLREIANRNSRDPGGANSDSPQLEKLQKQYSILRKSYLRAYNDFLDAERNPKVDLSIPENTTVLFDALKYWEGKRLKNHAFCIMPNHIHWVLELLEKDENGEAVYLQDILYSVKRFTANEINKIEKRKGALWQKESFDTTIRDEKHLYYAIEYTLNNPVNAALVEDWRDWKGTYLATGLADSDPPLK